MHGSRSSNPPRVPRGAPLHGRVWMPRSVVRANAVRALRCIGYPRTYGRLVGSATSPVALQPVAGPRLWCRRGARSGGQPRRSRRLRLKPGLPDGSSLHPADGAGNPGLAGREGRGVDDLTGRRGQNGVGVGIHSGHCGSAFDRGPSRCRPGGSHFEASLYRRPAGHGRTGHLLSGHRRRPDWCRPGRVDGRAGPSQDTAKRTGRTCAESHPAGMETSLLASLGSAIHP